ncbi:hypothetical protein C8N30_0770 [Sulfitobacter guttiformis]|uniref:Uncharacterized protein n=1 Tax=Sulfitobacter guttiformis TaxID=74349 RepID=A0A420DPY5_9RHOB|nr:hypothetical protein C8N30_0770 [Sulfitobacter guttiformis]
MQPWNFQVPIPVCGYELFTRHPASALVDIPHRAPNTGYTCICDLGSRSDIQRGSNSSDVHSACLAAYFQLA